MAEFQELIFFDPAGESKFFRSHAHPFTGHRVCLTVIIAELEMLFEVFFRVVQVGLNLGGQHAVFLPHSIRRGCDEFITTRHSKFWLDGGMNVSAIPLFFMARLTPNFVRCFSGRNLFENRTMPIPKAFCFHLVSVRWPDDFCSISG